MAGRFGDGRVSAENAADARKTPIYRKEQDTRPVGAKRGLFFDPLFAAQGVLFCGMLPGGAGCKRQRADVISGGTEIVKL